MPESGLPANKIDELRRRFEEQPASRVFLQLAEEYRRLGLPEQAVDVLEAGLAKRPGDLSGMVALGRCRLELGLLDGAVATLEAVIDRDAAHLVANKLLIEAHLQQGDPGRAGQRLDLYKLLNDRDPEIDDLETRLRSLRRAAREAAEITVAPEPAVEPAEEAVAEPPAEDPFASALAAAREAEAVAQPSPQPVFELEPEPPPPPPAPMPLVSATPPVPAVPEQSAIFSLDPLPTLSIDELWNAGAAQPRVLRQRIEPFGVLPPLPAGDPFALAAGEVPAVVQAPEPEPPPVVLARVEEPIFETQAPPMLVEEPAEVWPVETAPVEVAEPEIAEVEIAPTEVAETEIAETAAEPVEIASLYEPVEATIEVSSDEVLASRMSDDLLDEEPSTVAIDLPEPVELPRVEAPIVAAPVAEASVIEAPIFEISKVDEAPSPAHDEAPAHEIPAATVTLGELYLAQGHLAEARQIFTEVLEREPHNTLARAALARLETPSVERLTAARLLAGLPAGEVPQGLTAKKILVLSAYLQRLRRHHVR